MIRKALCLILFCIALVGCSNHLLEDAPEYTGTAGTGIVTVSMGGEDTHSRTVFPQNTTNDLEDFVDIQLTGKINGTTVTPENKASWTNYNDLKTDGTEIILAAGNWDLTLTAKRYGATFTQTLTDVAVADGTTTRLEFNNMRFDVFSISAPKTGKVEVTLEFPTDLNITRYTAKLNTEEETELTGTGARKTFTKDEVQAGSSHQLTFYGYNAAGAKVFTYPTTVVVEAGYKSSAVLSTGSPTQVVQSNKQSVTVTYKINNTGSTTTDYPQTYYAGSHILSPDTLGFTVTGKVLKNWNTRADGTGTAYQPNEMPALTVNTDLYAIWWAEGSFVVTYNYNTSSTDSKNYPKEVTSGSTAYHPTNNTAGFTWSGKTFLGWDTKRDGSGTRYDANTTITLTESTILYAQWATGSAYSGYTISSDNEWNAVFNSSQAATAAVRLGADITAPNTAKTKDLDFAGTFDGDNYTISGLSTNLFKSVASGGIVQDLTLDSSISGISSTTAQGMVANTNAGTITDVTVKGTLTNSYGDDIGGVVGKNTGTVTSCTSSVSISGKYDVGGVIGENRGTCSYNNFSGTADGSGTGSNVGGIVGYNYYDGTDNGTVTYCMAWGTVQASASTRDTNVGGIIGEAEATTAKTTNVSYCAAAGTITGGKYQGGLIGYNHQSRAQYCYAKGVEFTYLQSVGESSAVGGLYGYEFGGDSQTGWEESYSHCTVGTTATLRECVGAPTPRSGTVFKYNDGVELSDLNKGGEKWYTNTGANGVSTKLPYEVRRP
ncbi:MAG: InlB B-repeat-containing protein [Spirochaetaceae bacterium]|nr:InlB B-repeat-containing protein [Spirochaetaceae bacterium]